MIAALSEYFYPVHQLIFHALYTLYHYCIFCSHDRVLEAVTVNGEVCNFGRFDPILQALKLTKNPVFQLACMQFINAIVNTPEELDFRVHLRNEFMRGGLGEVLAVREMISFITLNEIITATSGN